MQLPGAYEAIRRKEPAFTLQNQGDVDLKGPPIVVPASQGWWVEEVAVFRPPPRLERRERALAAQRSPITFRGPRVALWILGVALALAVGSLWFWLQ